MRHWIAAAFIAAALAAPASSLAEEQAPASGEAFVVCPHLTLYAGAHDASGAWQAVRVEDGRAATPAVYTAQSAEPVTVEGGPGLLLRSGRVQFGSTALSFDQIVIGACPEALTRTQTGH